MEITCILLGIMSMVCFGEYHTLSKNNIRHDEHKYFVMGIVLLIILFLVLVGYPFIELLETETNE